MLESLYRAKRIRNNEWVSGWYCRISFGNDLEPAIIPKREGRWEPIQIQRDTLCRFVGRKDIRQKKIFEGDIVYCYGGECYQGNYEYFEKVVVTSITDAECISKINESENILIIGNVFDRPDLVDATDNV